MIKAILSDFDGTLVDFNGHYDPAIIPLLATIKTKNVTFSMATGRSYYGIVGHMIRDLGIDGIHIFHGGSFIYDTLLKKELLHQPISAASAEWIISYWKSTGLLFSVETKNKVYISRVQPVPTYSSDLVLHPIEECAQFDNILKILLFAKLNSLQKEVALEHFKKITDHCKDIELMKILRFGYYGCDVTSEKATKHTAVLEYMKLQGLKKEEVVAIGDDYNDYPLFTAAGYNIAMDNAPQEVKEIAHLIVPKTENGGMKMALADIIKKLDNYT